MSKPKSVSLPSKGNRLAAPTTSTPGSCASRLVARSNQATQRARSASLGSPFGPGSDARSVSTCSARMPGSTARSLTKLRSMSPVPTSSTSDSATSATTSVLRSRPRVELVPRVPSLSASFRSGREPASAGARPKPTPVTSATAMVNASTRPSSATSLARGSASGLMATSASTPHTASKRPSAAPDRRQEQALGQKLADEPRAPGAERRANGHLAVARRRAREHQVGDVGAGDEQHEPDRAEQHEQRDAHVADDVVEQRLFAQRPAAAPVVVRIHFEHTRGDGGEIGVELRARDAGLLAARRA